MKLIPINATRILLMIVLAGTLFSCVKKTNEPPSTRKTVVKILGGGTPASIKKMPVDFIPVATTLLVVDLRREPTDEAGLFATTNVVVTDDVAAVQAAGYVLLPESWYTIQSEAPKVGGSGGTFSFVFQPSEFAKEISITLLDPTLMDPSTLYGLGFTITSVDPSGQISNSKSVVIEIGAKNDWDGTYAVRGPVVDVVTPNLIEWANQPGYSDPWLDANPGAWEAHLITISATDCIVFDNTLWGAPALPLYNTNPIQNTGYGGFGMIFTFDPATNAMTKVRNYYGDPTAGPATVLGNPASGTGPPLYQASNTRYGLIDPSGTNQVQGNRDILVKYWMFHPSVLPSGPRTTITNHYEYIGPR